MWVWVGILKDTPVIQRVNTVVKAICVDEVGEVPDRKRKRTFMIADSTGNVRLQCGRMK